MQAEYTSGIMYVHGRGWPYTLGDEMIGTFLFYGVGGLLWATMFSALALVSFEGFWEKA